MVVAAAAARGRVTGAEGVSVTEVVVVVVVLTITRFAFRVRLPGTALPLPRRLDSWIGTPRLLKTDWVLPPDVGG